jgi:hypothetical protein
MMTEAFGLRIAATAPLPGLAPTAITTAADVIVDLRPDAAPPADDGTLERDHVVYRSPDTDETGRPLLTVERRRDGGFQLRYADGIAFVVDAGGRHIAGTWPPPWTLDDAATYLLGPVFALALRLRGVTCLHASAVAIAGGAVAFVGPPGAGKSTLAAAFARRGHAVIADDVLPLREGPGGPWAHPGPARIRLWPESVAALYGAPDALPRLTPSWDKRFLDLTAPGHQLQDRALPLRAIYVLNERGPQPSPRLVPMSPAAALMALVANTQATHLLDGGRRAEEFRALGRLAATVAVRRVVPPDDVGRLHRLCEAIVDDLQARADRV